MYYYILDLGNKQIVKIKEKMEITMASYGISGDFGKISPLSSAYELAKKAKEEGYTTVVAVGGSEVINQVASVLVNSNITMGIIPLLAPSTIYRLIGTDSHKKALEILKVRKIETIDVGKISEAKYFLTEAKIKNPTPLPTILDFEGFRMGGSFKEITVANGIESKEGFKDGLLDILIDYPSYQPSFFSKFFKKKIPAFSVLHGKSLKVETEEQANILVDDEVVSKTPCQVTIKPKALKLIIARRA